MSISGLPMGAFADGAGGGPPSVQSPIDVLAENPGQMPIYLVIASPYDPGASATTDLYYATAPFTSDASDTPSAQAFTENRIGVPVRLSNRLDLRRGSLQATGTTAGDIEFFTLDGGADALASYLWDGRDVRVLIGFEDYTLAECAEIFKGTAEGAAWNRSTIRIRLRSPRFKLERDIQTTLYAGTGGVEGGDEIKGKCKPLVYGQVRQQAPVLVDGTNLVYQSHDGSVQAVNAVRDRGVALAFDADYVSYAALIGATIAGGEYGTCLAEGLIRLGASPDGIVTCDVQGDDSGSLGASGYTSTAADIIRKIVTTKGPLTDPDDLDTGSLADLNTATSAVVGVSTSLERVSVAAVVDSVADSVGAFIDFTRNGRLRARRLDNPSTATASHTITSIDPDSWDAQNADIPAHTVKLGYRHYPKTLSGEEAAGSLGDTTRLDFGQGYRDTTSEDASILTLHPSAALYEVQTLIDTSGDADTEADRRLALYKPTRHFYEVRVWSGLYVYALGDVVDFQIPRYDLTSGKNFVVIGIDEEPIQSQNHQNIATLRLWGREN